MNNEEIKMYEVYESWLNGQFKQAIAQLVDGEFTGEEVSMFLGEEIPGREGDFTDFLLRRATWEK